MIAAATSIRMAGKKLCELKVSHKGVTMPVNVYAAVPRKGEPFMLCVCFEDAPIETRLYIDKNNKGEWVEIFEGDDELARTIGPLIETNLKPVIYN